MIRGSDIWTSEFDRIVGGFRKLKADSEYASQVDDARDAAIAELKKLGMTAGEALEILTRSGRRR